MRGKLVIPIIGVIILSFFGSSFAEQKVQTKSIQVTAGVLPDLVVESIWLDGQCNINFKLKNSGQGNIPDGEHKESVVRVQFGSEIKDLLLGRIDPNGALKKAGGLVSFNTQMTLKSSIDVKVIVDFNQKIKETDAGEKNNEKVLKLTPQCPSVAKIDLKTKTLTDEGAKSQTSDMPLQKSKTLTIPPPGKVGTQADTAPLNITILSPTKNSSWNIGSSLNIQWKVMVPTGIFHILLKTPGMADTLASGVGEPVVATIASYTKMQPNQQGVFSYDWKIPSFITPQDYIVKIIYADDPKVFSKSEIFKISKGGPSIITPKTLYSGPPVKGFGVDVPSSSNQWRAGEAARIFWQILNTIFSDQNSLDQMDEKVRIVLKDMGGAERLTIAQNVVNRKWVDWQNLNWTIPEGFPDGKYIVRVETPDGHFYGESSPFTIWNPKVVKMDKKTDKLVGSDHITPKVTTPPPQVTGTFKLVSMTPFMNSQTKLLEKIDLTGEIDASSDFQLVGDHFPVDPMLRPVSMQPHILLMLYHKQGWKKYEVLGWDGYCGMPPFVCPTGVLKKGKNVVKFTIYVQSIPQSENRDRCNPSWWGPLTIKTNEESSYWDQNTGKYLRVIKVVQADFDLDILVTVTLNLYGGGGLGPLGLEAIVSQPRGSKYLEHGTLGQNYGCDIY